MSIEKVVLYKVHDKLFNSEEEANQFLIQENLLKREHEKLMAVIKNKKRDIITKVNELYHNKNYLPNRCNCDGTFSSDCLVHLCTCEAGQCDRHTNLHFENLGCYWCGYTDCSKYRC